MSNLRTLMFHDVVFEDQFNSSGFPGNDSAIYKLTQKQFSKYLNLLKNGGEKQRKCKEPTEQTESGTSKQKEEPCTRYVNTKPEKQGSANRNQQHRGNAETFSETNEGNARTGTSMR